jgi:hypothetical protein
MKRFSLRVDDEDLWEWLVKDAAESRRSINEQIVWLLEQRRKEQEAARRNPGD